MNKKRFFAAVGHGNRLGKWWTSTQLYEYVDGIHGVNSVAEVLSDMKKNFHVFTEKGEEKEYELEVWEDINCPGCTANSCLKRSRAVLKKQSPVFEDNLLVIWPRCKNTNTRFSVRAKGVEVARINDILNDPEAYYKLSEIKTLHTALDLAYQIALSINSEPASLMRLVALREEARL